MLETLWWLASCLVSILTVSLVDYLLFLLVDFGVKCMLETERDIREKRLIWTAEAVALLVLALLLGSHHLVLWLMALATLVSAQLKDRVDIDYWWHLLSTRWDEFQQHEKSMENYHSRQAVPVPLPPVQPQIMNQPYMRPTAVQWMPAAGPQVVPMPPPVIGAQGEFYPPNFEPWYAPNIEHRLPTPQPGVMYGMRETLARKPIRAYRLRKQPSENPPPGLRNSGRNICFMNSVMQCLSRTPYLTKCFPRDSSVDSKKLVNNVFNTLQQLNTPVTSRRHVVDLDGLRASASKFPGSTVVDPSVKQAQQDVGEYLSWLLGALHQVTNTQGGMHITVEPPPPATDILPGQVQAPMAAPRLAAITLNMLRYIYGDIDLQKIERLKAQCKEEISQAHGLDNDSHGEPIQRLSDLEWLGYKSKNRSAIDDLFTGQMVESQHCIECNHMSINTQTFNILPVPIAPARHHNGLVYLEDCFARYGQVEDLVGPEGMHCENCSVRQDAALQASPVNCHVAAQSAPRTIHPATPVRKLVESPAAFSSPILQNGGNPSENLTLADLRRRKMVSQDPAFQASPSAHPVVMSPIPHEGDGCKEYQFKTSTPIELRGLSGGGTPPRGARLRRTDGQRRSLLRQLPECLIVQLMRFCLRDGAPHKLRHPVSVPLVNLDLTSLIIDNVIRREDMAGMHGGFQYSLYAVCVHEGGDNPSYGHYLSYAVTNEDVWYKFDDETVSPVNMDYEINTRQVRENAYILFFRKSILG